MFKKHLSGNNNSSVNISNLFEYDFVQSWKKIPKCVNCNSEFNGKIVASNKYCSNRPMILDCSHNICEQCLFHRKNYIICGLCNKKTIIDHNSIRLKNEYNYNLMGILWYTEKILRIDLERIIKVKNSNQDNTKADINKNCFECTSLTKDRCIQCNASYCRKCFEKVHKNGKIFQTHQLVTEQSTNDKNTENKIQYRCYKHKKNIDHYCHTCATYICIICKAESHGRHQVVHVQIENNKFLPKAQNLIETINNVKEKNKHAQKNAKFVENKFEEYASETIEDISNCFINMHTILQMMEKELLLKVKNNTMPLIQKAKLSYSAFSANEEKLENLHKTLSEIISGGPASGCVLFENVISNINETLRKLPCNVIFNNFEENPLQFHLNIENIQNEFEKLFTLQLKPNPLNVKMSTYLNESIDVPNLSIQYGQINTSLCSLSSIGSDSNTFNSNKKNNNSPRGKKNYGSNISIGSSEASNSSQNSNNNNKNNFSTKNHSKIFYKNNNNKKATTTTTNTENLNNNNKNKKQFYYNRNQNLRNQHNQRGGNCGRRGGVGGGGVVSRGGSRIGSGVGSGGESISNLTFRTMSLTDSILETASISDDYKLNIQKTESLTKNIMIPVFINPNEFYVRTQESYKSYDRLIIECNDEAEFAVTPNYIDVNLLYLVFNSDDQIWCRGKIIEFIENENTYKVFLIDSGYTKIIPKQRIRDISNNLKEIPAGVFKCSIYNIKPKDNDKWADDATHMMYDITSKDKIQMLSLKEENKVHYVDIIMNHNNYSISVRDALLFADIAEPIIDYDDNYDDEELIRHIHKLEDIKKSLLRISDQPTFFKNSFSSGENFRVIVLNIINPQQFYAVKYDHKEALKKLQDELNEEYEKQKFKIYCPQLEMPCAVYIDSNWYRAKICSIVKKGEYRVWLVDKGTSEIVHWKKLRVLDEKFLTSNEYAFQCSLADIEPLQENYYSWTNKATSELDRITKNPVIQMFIKSSKDFHYRVVMHIIKKHSDVNVNALMVQYGHAVSTGEDSVQVEYQKNTNNVTSIIHANMRPSQLKPSISDEFNLQSKINTNENNNTGVGDDDDDDDYDGIGASGSKKKKSSQNLLIRRNIKITHIESPGEFYVQLCDHLSAIKKIHEEIQLSQKSSVAVVDSIDEKEWKINENCLISTKLISDTHSQWYRGVIVDIHHIADDDDDDDDNDDDEDYNDNVDDNENEKEEREQKKKIKIKQPDTFYTVFLRDHGIRVTNVPSIRLTQISSLYNKVCNGAFRCHMACVRPTGGLDTWSCSAMDEMKRMVKNYKSLSAELQGKRKNNSLPVILFGLNLNIPDALAPATLKWININKIFVNLGLAHLTEKFDTKQNNNELTIENEIIKDNQEPIVDWVNKLVNDNITKEEDNEENTDYQNYDQYSVISYDELAKNETNNDNFEICVDKIKEWIPAKPITKTVFAAYPTYVDDNGIVYLHDSKRKIYLGKIKEIINKNIDKLKNPPDNIKWFPGKPCLALYHLDNNYYRAIINKIVSEDLVSVQFIDYGNIEECAKKDLKDEVILGNVPIQATKYQIDGVMPINDNENWSRDILDFIHVSIVGKLCTVRIASNQENKIIKKCSIRFENYDLAKLLISENHAKQKYDNDEIRESSKIDYFIDENVDDDDDDDDNDDILSGIIETKKDDKMNEIMDIDDYKKLFEKIELKKISALNASKKESNEDADEGDIIVETEYWKYDHGKNYDYDNKQRSDDESSVGTIKNPDKDDNKSIISVNSSKISPEHILSKNMSMSSFQYFKMPRDLDGFYCETLLIIDPTTLHVHPFLSDTEKLYNNMFKEIQNIAPQLSQIMSYTDNSPCLALYSEDKCWYRGLIRSHFPDISKCDVLFVDYLNAELINVKNIKYLPRKFIDVPIRHIEINLHGIKPNPRYRANDIERKLCEILNNRRFYAKIIEIDDEKCSVILYDSEKENYVIYEELLRERFFIKNNNHDDE